MPEARLQRTRDAYHEEPGMECIRCHVWFPPDPETGYDADDLCGGCQAQGWYIASDGSLAHEDDDFYYDRIADEGDD